MPCVPHLRRDMPETAKGSLLPCGIVSAFPSPVPSQPLHIFPPKRKIPQSSKEGVSDVPHWGTWAWVTQGYLRATVWPPN